MSKENNLSVGERNLLFMLMLETNDKDQFRKAYRALVWYAGKSRENEQASRLTCNNVMNEKYRAKRV